MENLNEGVRGKHTNNGAEWKRHTRDMNWAREMQREREERERERGEERGERGREKHADSAWKNMGISSKR